MKARIKATGEIVNITYSHYITSGGAVMKKIYKDQRGKEYFDNELEFLQEEEEYIPDYWEKLKHQAAISAMQGILSNPESELDYKDDETLPQAIAGCAAKIAHALVEKLKEEK